MNRKALMYEIDYQPSWLFHSLSGSFPLRVSRELLSPMGAAYRWKRFSLFLCRTKRKVVWFIIFIPFGLQHIYKIEFCHD